MKTKPAILKLAEWPNRAFPLIFETAAGRKLVTVLARHSDDSGSSYEVQFPDGREAFLKSDLLDRYSQSRGLRLNQSCSAGQGREKIEDSRIEPRSCPARKAPGLLRHCANWFSPSFLHLIVLIATLALFVSANQAIGLISRDGVWLPFLAVFVGILGSGLVHQLHELLRRKPLHLNGFDGLMMMAGLTLVALTNPAVFTVFALSILGVGSCLMASRRYGSVQPRLQAVELPLLAASLGVAGFSAWITALFSGGEAGAIVVSLMAGTHSLLIAIRSEWHWQRLRLARI
ncbi:MAG: hypothetical protein AAF236_17800 [Verrucomicrobiota bacterium]